MNEEYAKGRYLKFDGCPPGKVSWRFAPLKKGGKIAADLSRYTLYDQKGNKL